MKKNTDSYRKYDAPFKTKGIYIRWYLGSKGFQSVYPVWVDGVKKSREKAFATREEAIAFCMERDKEIQLRGRMSSLLLDEEEKAALAKLKKTFPNLSLVSFIERFLPFLESDYSNVTVAKIFEIYVEKVVAKRQETGSISKYLDDIKHRCKVITSAFGSRIASSVSPTEFREFIVNLKTKTGKDASSAYKNTLLTMAKSAFRSCQLQNLETVEKISDKLHKSLDDSRKNVKFFTPLEAAEILRLFMRCKDLRKYLPLLVWQLFTGGRNSECIGCVTALKGKDRYNKAACPRWSEILPHLKNSEEESQIILYCPKKQTRKKVTLTPILKTWLNFARKLIKVDDYGYISPDGAKVDCLSKIIKSAHLRYTNNIFRHTHISYQLALTNSPELVAREHGHSVAMVLQCYDEVVTKEQAEAFFSLTPENVLDNAITTDSKHRKIFEELRKIA